jgi:peptidoglycan hydrolase CwlO-like protein
MKKLFVTSMFISLLGITAFGQVSEREFKHVEMSKEQAAPEISGLDFEIIQIEGKLEESLPEMDKQKTTCKEEILGTKEE